MKYNDIKTLIEKNVGKNYEFINKELFNMDVMFRWFIIQDSKQVQKLNSNIYKVETANNRKGHLNSEFIDSISLKLQSKYHSTNIHTSCTLNAEYGNLASKDLSELFIVVPLGDFTAIQSSLAKDLIDFTSPTLPKQIHSIGKEYIAKAFEHAEKDFYTSIDSNVVRSSYFDLNRKRPYFVDAVEQIIVDSYSNIEDKIYHDQEVLLYCEQYLLIKASLAI